MYILACKLYLIVFLSLYLRIDVLHIYLFSFTAARLSINLLTYFLPSLLATTNTTTHSSPCVQGLHKDHSVSLSSIHMLLRQPIKTRAVKDTQTVNLIYFLLALQSQRCPSRINSVCHRVQDFRSRILSIVCSCWSPLGQDFSQWGWNQTIMVSPHWYYTTTQRT